ncbi:hypothetical protein Bbelb_183970 [Branchiostoma belcheri]|nr:hypothetical protein Bbelb_183970 [Branchiostoma belcheri]
MEGYVCYVCSENVGSTHVTRTVAQSVVCTPSLAVSGCVHRTLRKWRPYSPVRLSYGTYGARASLLLPRTGGESVDRTQKKFYMHLKFYGVSACSQIRKIPYGGGFARPTILPRVPISPYIKVILDREGSDKAIRLYYEERKFFEGHCYPRLGVPLQEFSPVNEEISLLSNKLLLLQNVEKSALANSGGRHSGRQPLKVAPLSEGSDDFKQKERVALRQPGTFTALWEGPVPGEFTTDLWEGPVPGEYTTDLWEGPVPGEYTTQLCGDDRYPGPVPGEYTTDLWEGPVPGEYTTALWEGPVPGEYTTQLGGGDRYPVSTQQLCGRDRYPGPVPGEYTTDLWEGPVPGEYTTALWEGPVPGEYTTQLCGSDRYPGPVPGEYTTALWEGPVPGEYTTQLCGSDRYPGPVPGEYTTALWEGPVPGEYTTQHSGRDRYPYTTALWEGPVPGEYTTALWEGPVPGEYTTALWEGPVPGEYTTQLCGRDQYPGPVPGEYTTALWEGPVPGEYTTALWEGPVPGEYTTALWEGLVTVEYTTQLYGSDRYPGPVPGEYTTALWEGPVPGEYTTALWEGPVPGEYTTAFWEGPVPGEYTTQLSGRDQYLVSTQHSFVGGTALWEGPVPGEYTTAFWEGPVPGEYTTQLCGDDRYPVSTQHSFVGVTGTRPPPAPVLLLSLGHNPPYVLFVRRFFWEATSATFFLKTWGSSGIDARHSHGCARCNSVVCTPRLADSVRRRYSPRTDALRLPTFLHVDSTQQHGDVTQGTSEEAPSNLPTVLIAVGAVGGAVLVVLTIAVCRYCLGRRKGLKSTSATQREILQSSNLVTLVSMGVPRKFVRLAADGGDVSRGDEGHR